MPTAPCGLAGAAAGAAGAVVGGPCGTPFSSPCGAGVYATSAGPVPPSLCVLMTFILRCAGGGVLWDGGGVGVGGGVGLVVGGGLISVWTVTFWGGGVACSLNCGKKRSPAAPMMKCAVADKMMKPAE